ncbi:hypothetical protein Pelo_17968 [Pelomyxa schiedti]|nr:hypothetical protein Pelo_17968 [Pelomyxa schiedti]
MLYSQCNFPELTCYSPPVQCAHTKQVHQFIEDILHFSIFNKSTSSSWIYIAASLATALPVSTLSTLLSHLWSRLPHCGSQIVAAFLDFPVEATQCTILVTDQTTAGTYSSDNKYSGLWRGALVFLIAAAHTTTLRKQIFKALGILFSSTGFLQSGDIQSVVKLLLLPNVMDVWLELGCYLCSIRDIPPSLTSVEILCESQTLQPLREFGCLLLKQVFCVSPESRPLVLLTLLQRLSHCTIMNSKRKQPSLDTQSNTFLQVLHEIAGAMICCECADSQALFSLTLQHTIDIGPKGAYQIMCAFEELLLHLPSLIVQTLNFTKTLTKGDCDPGLSSGHKGGTHVIGMCLLAGLLPCLLRGPHEMELDQIEHYVTIVCDSLTQAVLHPSYSHIERRTLYDVISVLFEKCGEKLYLASPHYLSPLVIAEPLTQKLCSCIQWVNPPRKEAPVFEEIVTLSTTRDSEMGSELAELYLPYVIDHEEPVDSLLHCAVSFLSTYGECTALAPGVCALKVILHWVCVQFAAEKLEPKALGFTPRKMSEAGTFIPNIRSAYNLMLPCCMTLCAYDSTFHKGGLQETLLLCCEWLHKMCWSVKFYSCVSREIIERMVPPMVSVLKRCAVLLLGPREDEHREILCELSNISPLKALNFAVNVIYTQILNTRTHNLKPHLVDHNDTGITCFILSHTLSKMTDAGSSETTLSPSERKQLLGIQTTCLKVVCMLPQALFSPEVLKLISHPASDSSAHSDNIFVLLTWANSFSQQLRAFKIHPPHRSTVECELQSFSVKVNLIWILTRKSLLQHHHHLSDNSIVLSPASTSIVLSIASVMKEKLCQMRVPHVPPPPQTLEVMLQLILYSDLDSAPRFLSGVLQQSFSLSPRYSQMPLVQTKFVSKYTRQYKKFLQSRSRIVSAILSFFMHHLFCTCKLSYISIGNLLPQQIETKKFVARLHKPLFDSAIDYLFQLFKAACTSQLTVSAAALVFRVVCILVLLCIRIHNNLRETNSSTSPESEICWPVSLVLRLSKDITQWVEKGGADSVRPQTKRMVNAITPRCAKLQFMCNQLPPRRNEEGKEEESSAEEEEESESASAEEYAEEMLESDSETPESPGSAGGAIPSSSDSDTVSKTSPKRKSTRKTSASARKQQPQAPASHSNKSKHTKKARTNTSPPKPVTSTSTSTSASTTPTANSRKKRRKKRTHTAARSRNTVIDYLLSLDCNSDQELDPNDAFEDLEDWLVLTE